MTLLFYFVSKFWTRNRPGDKMRDRYNLNLLPGMSEDGVEYGKAIALNSEEWRVGVRSKPKALSYSSNPVSG